MGKSVTIISPAWPYRGGIAAFTERLVQQLQAEGHSVKVYTFTLQYPSFLFPGTTQYTASPKPATLDVERRLSSVNPLTWWSLGRKIACEAPDMLLLAYWMPFMAPCMGTVARLVRRNKHTRVVGILHNLIPHEHRPGDKQLSAYLVRALDGVVALSQSVCDEVHLFRPELPAVFSPHPLYDNFGPSVARDEACRHLNLSDGSRYLLFFGLIRDYKGLDWLLEAYAASALESEGYKLIVAGEFYTGGEKYHEQAKTLGLDDKIIWKTTFVPDAEVRYYFSAADLIVQPYKTATQSGVTQIAYHFEKPMLVTRVGGLAEIVPDGKVGYSVAPEVGAITDALRHFSEQRPDFTAGIIEEKRKYSWDVMSQKIMSLSN